MPTLYEQVFILPPLAPVGGLRRAEAFREQYARPYSRAYFCPVCGNIWGRIVVQNSGFACYMIPCADHPVSPFMVAGSVWDSFDSDFNESLPAPVLSRELTLHIAHLDRYGHGPNG